MSEDRTARKKIEALEARVAEYQEIITATNRRVDAVELRIQYIEQYGAFYKQVPKPSASGCEHENLLSHNYCRDCGEIIIDKPSPEASGCQHMWIPPLGKRTEEIGYNFQYCGISKSSPEASMINIDRKLAIRITDMIVDEYPASCFPKGFVDFRRALTGGKI